MDYRGLVVIGAVVCAAALPLLPACTAPDPGQITFVPRSGATNPADENGDNSSSGTLPAGDAGGATSSSGADAGGDPIFGTEAFTFQDPGETANGQPAPHVAPMQGKECGAAGCHADPGAAGPKWLAGGTVYADANGTALAAGSQFEIRIVDPKTNAVVGGGSFCPDTDGNFWLDPGTTATGIPEGSKVGIRKKDGTTKMMAEALTNATGANCNASGCHGSSTNRIYAP